MHFDRLMSAWLAPELNRGVSSPAATLPFISMTPFCMHSVSTTCVYVALGKWSHFAFPFVAVLNQIHPSMSGIRMCLRIVRIPCSNTLLFPLSLRARRSQPLVQQRPLLVCPIVCCLRTHIHQLVHITFDYQSRCVTRMEVMLFQFFVYCFIWNRWECSAPSLVDRGCELSVHSSGC